LKPRSVRLAATIHRSHRECRIFGDGAGRQRDAGLIGAAQRDNLLFRDQPQRLFCPTRAAWLSANIASTLAAETARPAFFASGKLPIRDGIVDDVDRGLDRGLAVHAGAGCVAAQR